jgi:hypothetical protein
MYEGPEDIQSVITHVLCISKFKHLSGLGFCHMFVFPKLVGFFDLFGYLRSIVYIGELGFGHSYFSVFMCFCYKCVEVTDCPLCMAMGQLARQ